MHLPRGRVLFQHRGGVRNGYLEAPGQRQHRTGKVAMNSQSPDLLSERRLECLAADELHDRIEEEISRSTRLGTGLGCLLVAIDNLDELVYLHGESLGHRALDVAASALRGDLRRFDRVGRPSSEELALVLPGVDERRAEVVARRALGRLQAIKIEVAGERQPLRLSVGIAAWREGESAAQLLARARAALRGPLNERAPSELTDELARGFVAATRIEPPRPA
jgi:diguanylate cyclase (GGDEF)-like protein